MNLQFNGGSSPADGYYNSNLFKYKSTYLSSSQPVKAGGEPATEGRGGVPCDAGSGAGQSLGLLNIPYFPAVHSGSKLKYKIEPLPLGDVHPAFERRERFYVTPPQELRASAILTQLRAVERASLRSGVIRARVYADVVELKRFSPPSTGKRRPTGAVRGPVTDFSRRARRRMMFRLYSLQKTENGYFITLTYPDAFPQDWHVWKKHLKNFKRRLERRFPNVSAHWRLEMKERKSGASAGCFAPHFHILLFDHTLDIATLLVDAVFLAAADTYKERFVVWRKSKPLRQQSKDKFSLKYREKSLDAFRVYCSMLWHDVVASDLPDIDNVDHYFVGTNVRSVNDRRHAMAYVSKYVAKLDEGDGLAVGRRWGVIGKPDTSYLGEWYFPADELNHDALLGWASEAVEGHKGNTYPRNRYIANFQPERWRYSFSVFSTGAVTDASFISMLPAASVTARDYALGGITAASDAAQNAYLVYNLTLPSFKMVDGVVKVIWSGGELQSIEQYNK